jgi:hypothetical protein
MNAAPPIYSTYSRAHDTHTHTQTKTNGTVWVRGKQKADVEDYSNWTLSLQKVEKQRKITLLLEILMSLGPEKSFSSELTPAN